MGYSEVQDFKTTNTSLDKSESGEVLAYKIGQQHAYPYMLLTVKDVNSKSEFNKFLILRIVIITKLILRYKLK